MMKPCPVCGSNPCYGICPMNDPFCGDQQAESEAFEATSEDMEAYAARREAMMMDDC